MVILKSCKWVTKVEAAAGAIVLPISWESDNSGSTILPKVARIIFIDDGTLDTMQDPAPVVVEVIELGFWPPYSVGYLNWRSLVELWLDVIVTTFSPYPASIKLLATIKLSVQVEHAAKTPRYGASYALKA